MNIRPGRVAVPPWHTRLAAAQEIRAAMEAGDRDVGLSEAEAWLAAVDRRAYVGTRHHVVPKFVLRRWATADGQVRVYDRVECRY